MADLLVAALTQRPVPHAVEHLYLTDPISELGRIDGVMFSPGDLVVADEDGVVVVPRSVEEEVVRRAWEKVHAENIVRDEIAGGMTATAVFRKYGVL